MLTKTAELCAQPLQLQKGEFFYWKKNEKNIIVRILEEITEFTMISDDIIYVGLLLVSIAFGKITRQIPNTPVRKWTSSLFGLGKVFFVAW